MKHIHKLMCLALPLLLASCIKDGFDKENCPGEFVIIPTTPGDDGNDVEVNNVKTIIIDANGKEHIVESGSNKPLDIEDGTYTIVTVKGVEDDKVKVDKTTISVNTNPDGTASEPGYPIGGYTDITIGGPSSNEQENIKVPNRQQSRPLILEIKFEGENINLLESLTGLTDGIALSRDLNNGFAPLDGQDRHPATTVGSITYSLLPKQDSPNFYQDMRTLLGIDGDGTQTLTLTITYKEGTQKKHTFDITHSMDGFHTQEPTKPWIIKITLRLGADLEATIEDWKAGPESWMDAEQ